MVHVRDFSMYGHKRLRRTLLAGAFSVFLFLYGIVGIELPFLNNQNVEAQAEAQNIRGWAWTDTAGWVSFSCLDVKVEVTPGVFEPICDEVDNTTINYGVQLNADDTMTGYGWSDNLGWLKFGGFPANSFPTNGSGTTASNAKIVNGTLLGWARFCAGTKNGDCSTMENHPDGWDGWISLGGITKDGSPYTISYEEKMFNGFAWGNEVVGWFNWRPYNACEDAEGNPLSVCLEEEPFGFDLSLELDPPGPVTLSKGETSSDLPLTVTMTTGVEPEEVTFTSEVNAPLIINFNDNTCIPDGEENTCTVTLNVTARQNAAPGAEYDVLLYGDSDSAHADTSFKVIITEPLDLSCSASSESEPVKIGDIVTWTATPDDQDLYTWKENGFNDENGLSIERTYTTPGTKTITVTAGGETASCGVSVTKKPKYNEF